MCAGALLPTMDLMNKILIAAPLCFIAYGIIRLIDGADGEHGPGPAWTVGHLFFLLGVLLYAVVLVGLARTLRTVPARLAALAGLVGVLAFVRVIVVDLIVGFRAVDNADKPRISDEYDRWPGDLGIYDAFYALGPILFLLGLLTLSILLVRARRQPLWSPFLLLAGFVVISLNLDLMPLAGALLLGGLLPVLVSSDRLDATCSHPS